jgi:DNA-binding NarL/FixJ family response regulator
MMTSKKNTPTHHEHATLRFSLDVDRVPGDRLASLVEELLRSEDEISVFGLHLEPAALELTGPRASLEALRAKLPSEGLRRALGAWKGSFGQVSITSRPAVRRGRRVLVVDGDGSRSREDVETLARTRIEACAVSSIDAAQVMLQRSGLPFDAIVLRHALSDGVGLDLLDRVSLLEHGCSVLVIDEGVRPELAREYRRRGVFRYIGPPAGTMQLVHHINATMLDTQAWRQVEHPDAMEPDEPPRQLVDPEQGAARLAHVCRLSTIEREVALMVLLGLRDLEIAEKLGQSERTAKRYVGKVLEKAGIQNRASLWSVLHQDGIGALPVRAPDASVVSPAGNSAPEPHSNRAA